MAQATFGQIKQLIAAAELHGAVDSAVAHFKAVGPIEAGSIVNIEFSVQVKKADLSITLNENSVAVPTITQADEVIFIQG